MQEAEHATQPGIPLQERLHAAGMSEMEAGQVADPKRTLMSLKKRRPRNPEPIPYLDWTLEIHAEQFKTRRP